MALGGDDGTVMDRSKSADDREREAAGGRQSKQGQGQDGTGSRKTRFSMGK